MECVKIGKVYRHFKGNYYFVENIAVDSETKERMVVYKPLYEREDQSDDRCGRYLRIPDVGSCRAQNGSEGGSAELPPHALDRR